MNLKKELGARDLFIIGIIIIFVGYVVANSVSTMLAGFINIAAIIVLLVSAGKGIIWLKERVK